MPSTYPDSFPKLVAPASVNFGGQETGYGGEGGGGGENEGAEGLGCERGIVRHLFGNIAGVRADFDDKEDS